MLSLASHVVILGLLALLAVAFAPSKRPVKRRPVTLMILEPKEAKEKEEEPKEEEDDPVERPDGQIVETPPPPEEVTPEEADYVAEHDNSVEEETRTRFKVNPEVVADVWSPEDEYQKAAEMVEEVPVENPDMGAPLPAPPDRFNPADHGSFKEFMPPSPATNLLGETSPMAPSQLESKLSGAPQNDLLDEKLGERTALNTKEDLYAGYLNRIRRLVNFYWQQNLDNLPRSVRLSRPRYTTVVEVVLNSDGALEMIEVVDESSVPELDDAVVRAFHLAGPFPNPPEGLIEKDGRVYLPSMEYTVELHAARMQYQGIDPRAGNQFPGILKSPR